jgi:hypothetical protein
MRTLTDSEQYTIINALRTAADACSEDIAHTPDAPQIVDRLKQSRREFLKLAMEIESAESITIR